MRMPNYKNEILQLFLYRKIHFTKENPRFNIILVFIPKNPTTIYPKSQNVPNSACGDVLLSFSNNNTFYFFMAKSFLINLNILLLVNSQNC